MNDFYSRQTNWGYILLSISSIILAETIFGFAWDGSYDKSTLKLFAGIVFGINALNSYFFFKNLANGNKNIRSGFAGGITVIVVVFALLLSFVMLFL
ncbi:hypothetical protein HUW51_04805 [Adhaeribacter swui]|uniref:Uncharacterized protein n=1 Tax=Adhaeribacter swui TaxID=2086471 RepID=A0A7G7G4J7_9BACT|nr:hypothetical protein [Adhaeribacter swui]QNF32081.1 hypothetical protein HUW51_04805 [Adhaeribacter swui]